MGIIKKLVKLKEEAFAKGTSALNELRSEYQDYLKSMFQVDLNGASEADFDRLRNNFIGLNPIEATKFIYNKTKFYEYLKYSFLGKHYEKKLNLIAWIIILIAVIIGIIIYKIFGMGIVFGISVIVLIIALYLIFKFFFKTGESYKSYYNRTMMDYIFNFYPDVSYGFNIQSITSDEEIKAIINRNFTKRKTQNNITFIGNLVNGSIFDLELTRTVQQRKSDGTVTKKDEKIFDGFYLKININNDVNPLKGNVIKIKADENMLSSLTEDTVRGIFESDLEFSFNSEEMNKSFDCKISGYNGFDNVAEMMMQVHKIITPSFEQHLLYLRERYNSFNMNISDEGIVATFNMERSLFQKAKHDELFDFKTTYREANEKFRKLSADLSGISDVVYYNVFPFMERIYLTRYISYLYLSYIDFDNYYDLNNGAINSFEEEMKNIYTMDIKEFKELYTEDIKEIEKQTKEFAKEFEMKEK